MSDEIKASVRECHVVKRVVVVEIPLEMAKEYVLGRHETLLLEAVEQAIADKEKEDAEDVPF